MANPGTGTERTQGEGGGDEGNNGTLRMVPVICC